MNKREIDRRQETDKKVKDLIKLAKAEAYVREKNMKKIKEKMGFHDRITKIAEPFTSPITEKLTKQEETTQKYYKGLEETTQKYYKGLEGKLVETTQGLADKLDHPPQIEYPKIPTIYPDKQIDIEIIKEIGFQTPLELIHVTEEELIKIKEKAIKKQQTFNGKKSAINNKKVKTEEDKEKMKKYEKYVKVLSVYIKRLNFLIEGQDIRGDGMLDKLTGKLFNEEKIILSDLKKIIEILTILLKKGDNQVEEFYDMIHNKIVDIMDDQFRKGKITKQYINKIYKIFSEFEMFLK